MPNIKKQVYDNIVNKLKQEINALEYKRNSNKWKIKSLAEEQTKLKQEQTALVNLIREVEIKKGK